MLQLHTTTLDNGLVVLAKKDGTPLTYGNRAQAATKMLTIATDSKFEEARIHEAPKHRFYVVIGAPRDIHKETAAEMFNVPIEYVTEQMRREGKRANFHDLYRGSSVEQFQSELEEYDPETLAAQDGDELLPRASLLEPEEFGEEEWRQVREGISSFIRSCRSVLIPSGKLRSAAAAQARRDRLNREARRVLEHLNYSAINYIKHVAIPGRVGGSYCAYTDDSRGRSYCAHADGSYLHQFSPAEIKTLTECGVLSYRRKRKQYRFDEAKAREVIGTY